MPLVTTSTATPSFQLDVIADFTSIFIYKIIKKLIAVRLRLVQANADLLAIFKLVADPNQQPL